MTDTTGYQHELDNINVGENSDLAIVKKEIGELLNEETTDDGLESLSGSLTSGLSEYLKQNNDTVNSLLTVLNNLKEPYANTQEIVKLKAFLQPLIKKDWTLDAPNEDILKVELSLDSNKQRILISNINELQNKTTDSGLKSTLVQISKIINNPNKQNFDQLSRFLDDNNVVGTTPDSSNEKAYVSTIINRLNTFLLSMIYQIDTQSSIIDANDNERANENKAYNELMSYIPGNLKKLNKMSDKDLKRLDAFIQRPNNQSQVFDLYYKMKYGVPNLNSAGMDTKDEEKFNNILNLIEKKYRNSTELHEYELGKVFEGVESNSGSLKEFLGKKFNKKDWNGENLSNIFDASKISDKYNFSNEEFINKFNSLNTERIKSNNEKILGINVSSLFNDETLNHFTIELEGDNVSSIKYNGETFNADTMFNLFKNNILILVSKTNLDFVNDTERVSCIENNKQGIFEKVVDYIKQNQPQQTVETTDSENPSTENIIEGNLDDFNLIEQVETQINNALTNHRIEGKFYEKVVGDNGVPSSIKYNMNVIKQYLEAVKDETYKGGGEDFKAITMAFQIALKYNFDGKYSDLGKIDGLFYLKDRNKNSKTKEQILQFQSDYGTEETIKDGKPGPQTIKLLLNILNNSNNPTESEPSNSSESDTLKINEEIVNSLNLKEKEGITTEQKTSLNIPEGITVYTKNGNENAYYYKAGENIVRVSTEEPRIKKSIKLQESSTNISEWTSNVNVCEGGKSKLESEFKTDDLKNRIGENDFNNLSIIISEGNPKEYQLKNGEIKISLSEDIFTKDFCGIRDIKEKLNLIYLATELKLGKVQITYTETSGIEHPILSGSRKYDINLSNIDMHNFDDFYKKIK